MIYVSTHIDPGPRENLEDAICAQRIQPLIKGGHTFDILIIADGVGGAKGGEYASSYASQVAMGYLVAQLAPIQQGDVLQLLNPDWVHQAMVGSLHEAHRAVRDMAQQWPELDGMATTMVLGVVIEDQLYVAWVGDSRAYLIRGDHLLPLSTDHSRIQQLLEANLINSVEVANHPERHVIYSCLGMDGELIIGTAVRQLQDGDKFMECSDGLSDVTPNDILATLFRRANYEGIDFDSLPAWLVDYALKASTTDNVSVLLAEYQKDYQGISTVPQVTLTERYSLELTGVLPSLQRKESFYAAA